MKFAALPFRLGTAPQSRKRISKGKGQMAKVKVGSFT
jgi:hypothetical protein